jgi:FkbM family methyltransferase
MMGRKLGNYLIRVKTWIFLYPVPFRAIVKWYDRLLDAVAKEKLADFQEFTSRGGVVPRHLLSDNQKFWQDGGNDVLYSAAEIQEKNVIVLGGYLGDSVNRYLKLGAQTVDVFEPAPAFFEKLQEKFHLVPQVSLTDKAAWIRDEALEFWLDGDGTGFSGREGTTVTVEGISFSTWLSRQEKSRDFFIEINIEGSEYAVIEDLLSTGTVNRLSTILVQFHNFAPESELQRALLRSKLATTHSETMNYPWVWEKWSLRSAQLNEIK